jgi:mRNA interferase MazF
MRRMPSTTRYRQGDIVLVTFPFTDLTSAKKRPALVISPDAINALNQDLILVGITSHLAGDNYAIYLEEDDFLDGALPKKSMVKTTKIFTIHSAIVAKRICRLKPEKLGQVLETIRKLFSRHD